MEGVYDLEQDYTYVLILVLLEVALRGIKSNLHQQRN